MNTDYLLQEDGTSDINEEDGSTAIALESYTSGTTTTAPKHRWWPGLTPRHGIGSGSSLFRFGPQPAFREP